ncbi:MAG: Helicase associated domain protein [Magnetococcales bacterium]|nr:Helicase associated domain protein [Magnetococcales bacterium]
MLPSHPDARRFLEMKLFHHLSHFRALEHRLRALPEESDRESAFALFAEGLLTIQTLPQATDVLPQGSLTAEIRHRLSLPEGSPAPQGYLRTTTGETYPYFLHYTPQRTPLTSQELAPFVQLMQNSHQPLLFSNGADLPKALHKQAGFWRILAPDLDRLTETDFNNFNRWLRGGGITPTRSTPTASQTERLNQIRSITTPRAILVPPLGAEVWQTARHLLENMGSQRIGLVILPSQNQVRELIHFWRRESSWSTLTPLVVLQGTGKTKPADLDYPITRSLAGLRHFFHCRVSSGTKVILGTDELLPLVQRAILGFPPIEMALILEAHRLETPQGESLKKSFSEKRLPIQKLFFISSTPQRMNPLKPNREGEIQPLYSFGNPEQYGPTVSLGTLPAAIQKKSIRPWKVLLPLVMGEQNHPAALALCVDKKPTVRHIHTRHASAKEAQAFAQGWLESRPESLNLFTPFCLEGQKGAAQLDQTIGDYHHSSHALLSLINTPEFGFGLPQADLIYFVQGARREEPHTFHPVLSPRQGEQSGLIAIALFLPTLSASQPPQEGWLAALDRCDDLWLSLQLFREQDTTFAEELRTIRINWGRTGRWELEPLSQWLEPLYELEPDPKMTQAILIHCTRRLTTLWDERFGQLLAFRDRYNHCEIPPRWADNPELSLWAEQQRKTRYQGRLSADRIKELEEIGFIWDPKKAAWEKQFKNLLLYRSQHQHCKVPKGWTENPELADWVIQQRRAFQSGRLEPEWSQRLDEVGFVWDLEVEAWESGFATLKKFRHLHGHAQVPKEYPQNPSLGEWAESQRRQEKSGRLAPERIERLDGLGFIWNLEEAAWEERFQLYERYRQLHGHGKVPDRDKNLPKLSDWAAAQRKEQARGTLDPSREQRLNDAGFVWDLEATAWEEAFVRLKSYKIQHNHCTLPDKGLPAGSLEQSLSQWCQEQRALRRRGRLHPTRINRLTALGFCWDLKIAEWEAMFADFLFFKRCQGHGKLPDSYRPNPLLGQWAKTQRRERTMGKLDTEREGRLEEAGFVWDLEAAAWDEGFEKLCRYHQKEGHFNLPLKLKSDPDLPLWVKKQRSLYNKKSLKSSRRERLEKIGFVWDIREAAWEEMFHALAQFTQSRNHCIVPAKWPENPRLAQWVNNLRRDYKKGVLPQDKVDRLTKLGFLWDAKAVFWEEMFAALTEYRDRNGDCLVPESYTENSELGWWVSTQRKANLSGQLDQARVQRLDALEFIWDIEDANWLEMYRQLFIFAQKNGHCIISKSRPETLLLASWADAQRQAKEQGKLSQDKINRLSELQFIWDAKQVVVEKMLMVLRRFKEEHGHCNVPIQGSNYSQLGLWIQFQRQSYQKGTLDPLRQQKLEEMGISMDG